MTDVPKGDHCRLTDVSLYILNCTLINLLAKIVRTVLVMVNFVVKNKRIRAIERVP